MPRISYQTFCTCVLAAEGRLALDNDTTWLRPGLDAHQEWALTKIVQTGIDACALGLFAEGLDVSITKHFRRLGLVLPRKEVRRVLSALRTEAVAQLTRKGV